MLWGFLQNVSIQTKKQASFTGLRCTEQAAIQSIHLSNNLGEKQMQTVLKRDLIKQIGLSAKQFEDWASQNGVEAKFEYSNDRAQQIIAMFKPHQPVQETPEAKDGGALALVDRKAAMAKAGQDLIQGVREKRQKAAKQIAAQVNVELSPAALLQDVGAALADMDFDNFSIEEFDFELDLPGGSMNLKENKLLILGAIAIFGFMNNGENRESAAEKASRAEQHKQETAEVLQSSSLDLDRSQRFTALADEIFNQGCLAVEAYGQPGVPAVLAEGQTIINPQTNESYPPGTAVCTSTGHASVINDAGVLGPIVWTGDANLVARRFEVLNASSN